MGQFSVEKSGLAGSDLNGNQQVCLNGHVITDSCEDFPAHCKPFCPDCGQPTIKDCPACNKRIPGHLRGVLSFADHDPPSFCQECGMAFPWQIAKVANTIEVLRQQGLSDSDLQELGRLLPDITQQQPMTQSSAAKICRILSSVAKPAYDICIQVVGDIAATTAKSYLGVK